MDGKWCRPAWCLTLHFLKRGEQGFLVTPALCGKQAAHRARVGWYQSLDNIQRAVRGAAEQRKCPKCLALGAPP